MKVIGFAGYSGAGKTTLIERLIPHFIADGQRVAVIKHSHHDIEWDTAGRDSWRHRQAGASQVILASAHHRWQVETLPEANQATLSDHIARLAPCDWVLAEGFKFELIPKLEILAPERPQLYPNDPHVIALVTDTPIASVSLPVFTRDAIAPLYSFLRERL